jgi:hypothetical protein
MKFLRPLANRHFACTKRADTWRTPARKSLRVFIAYLSGLVLLVLGAQATHANSFEMVVIDPDQAGDCKAAADIDRDGYPDLIVGGMPKEKLTWYRYPDWTKGNIATANKEFSTDCAVGDVDGDGDIDLVAPDGGKGNNLVWLENAVSKTDPTAPAAWKRHEVGAMSGFIKDVELADYDHDGRLDIAVRNREEVAVFFQTAAGRWTRVVVPDVPLASEGMASGDVDGDGFVDLIAYGAWVRNPGKEHAHDGGAWRTYAIGDVSPAFKATVADIDGDGRNDVLFSSSERTADVAWFTPVAGDPKGKWTKHVITQNVERAHTLQVADVDGDGDNDVVYGQMHTSKSKLLVIAYNLDGKGSAWRRVVIGATGLHNGVIVDIGNDGLPDIFGANWTGNPPVRLWRQKRSSNALSLAAGLWTALIVSRHNAKTFGLGFGDVNNDGRPDIVCGGFVYLNPGGDLSGEWTQKSLPAGMQAFAALDVDDDGTTDVIAQRGKGEETELVWLASKGAALADWTVHSIGMVPNAGHSLGAQGYRVADIVPGGKPEVAVSSGDGVYFFEAPPGPIPSPWRRTHVSGRPSDEGFAVGDIDRDGLPDIAATTGKSKLVEWYRNPGRTGQAWQERLVGDMKESHFPDRVELADLDRDGRLDIVVTEENRKTAGAKTFWWQQPASHDGKAAWQRHLLTEQATTHGLDAADIDRDGDIDLVTGEHRGEKRTLLWLNDGAGRFTAVEIARGFESHLGTRLYDLDGDGDLDIASIAWDDSGLVWIARNDSLTRAPLRASSPEVAAPEKSITAELVDKLRSLIRRMGN